ncbi:hypothetical protein K490DRAFT_48943 [Saccharata proteae CBS 121410]|uniref:Programmed cell death protein 2 C-terminal domain-containing protein n=1 Tax=Saccharata proteae CBS 121410 TaxID=1314787 RepID=A0A9P4LSH8_9PEZI|nr:hypothetical protein K490DRAFT_48943 [Saccharata proteae CBS 121410]
MPSYASDTSDSEDDGDYTSTSVTLGYASKEPTGDDFSQLGGYPTWLDGKTAPSAALARCKVCNDYMTLLLQLNADMPEHFPGHERRLYVFSCRRKTCRRKEGSVRGLRATRASRAKQEAEAARKRNAEKEKEKEAQAETEQKKPQLMGETLFGVVGAPAANATAPANPFSNPFSTGSGGGASSNPNPFASASSLAAKPAQKPTPAITNTDTDNTTTTTALPETFAQKARLASPPPSTTTSQPALPHEPWPQPDALPKPYPSYHLDADYETLSVPTAPSIPSNTRLDPDAAEPGSSSTTITAKDEKEAFESIMDKTFQKFADRLAQNPEQVLRYEFRGQPLLYSDTDAVGKMLGGPHAEDENRKVKVASSGKGKGLPRCANCGAERVFEMQLTPQAIAELEAEELGLEGMEWGTVVVGTCARDCGAGDVGDGEVGYLEEWVGVQWEELAARK